LWLLGHGRQMTMASTLGFRASDSHKNGY